MEHGDQCWNVSERADPLSCPISVVCGGYQEVDVLLLFIGVQAHVHKGLAQPSSSERLCVKLKLKTAGLGFSCVQGKVVVKSLRDLCV